MLAVLAAAGAASPTVWAGSADVEAREAPHILHADAASELVHAQAKGTGFAVTRHVIAGGGGRSTGAGFAVTGTIGQADADPLQPSTGGVFAISSGFGPGLSAAAVEDLVFRDGFETVPR
jgi:hypothetical protein